MIDLARPAFVPPQLAHIAAASTALDFPMSSTEQTGALLRTLVAAKPDARVLELGTGAGAGTAWLLSALSPQGRLLTVDDDPRLIGLTRDVFGADERVEIVEGDAGQLLNQLRGRQFDVIFADTWAGKFERLDDALALLAPGGLYVVDDLLPQPTWPEGHQPRVSELLDRLAAIPWLAVSVLDWSSGVLVGARLAAEVRR